MMISENALHAYSSSVRVKATVENCPVPHRESLSANRLGRKSGAGRKEKGKAWSQLYQVSVLNRREVYAENFLKPCRVTGAYSCKKKKSAQSINKLKMGGAWVNEISFPAALKFDAGYSWGQEKKISYCNIYLIHKY